MPDQSGAVNLADLGSTLSAEEEQRLQQMAEEHPPDPHVPGSEEEEQTQGKGNRVITAFVVIWNENGQVQVGAADGLGMDLMFPPSTDLIAGAASVLVKDMTAQETAGATINAQMQQMQAIAQQQEAARLQQSLGNLRGGQ